MYWLFGNLGNKQRIKGKPIERRNTNRRQMPERRGIIRFEARACRRSRVDRRAANRVWQGKAW